MKVTYLLSTLLLSFALVNGEDEAPETPKPKPKVPTKNLLAVGVTGDVSANVWFHLARSPSYTISTFKQSEFSRDWKWDNKHMIGSRVTQLSCDVKDVATCADLEDANFDSVVDFETKNLDQMKAMATKLKGKINDVYIYVSSATVYDVCERTEEEKSNPEFRLKEDDCQRPLDAEEREKLNKRFPTGHQILQVEEYLRREKPFPFIILRLPDTLSERDSTYGLWSYFAWAIASKKIEHPIHYPPYLVDKKLSFAYGDEVALVINKMLFYKPTEALPNSIYNEVYNLAVEETVTLREFLYYLFEVNQLVANAEVVTHPDKTKVFFPTYTKAALDITKLKKALDWTPYSLVQALHNVSSFYFNAFMRMSPYWAQRLEMLEGLCNVLDLDHDEETVFLEKIKIAYGLSDNDLYGIRESEKHEKAAERAAGRDEL